MGFTLIAVKEDARATMQLRNNNALGTIDNKGTVIGHERNFAHVHFLFFDVFYGAFRRFTFVDHQTQFDAQRCRIGHATNLTLFHVEDRLTQTVADVLQFRITAVALNREYGTERRFQTILAFGILLDELLERVKLDRKEIRNIQNLWTFSKILTNAFFLGIGVNHRVPQLADKSTRAVRFEGQFMQHDYDFQQRHDTCCNTSFYHS